MASVINENTLKTVDNGRAAVGDILSEAQSQLQKVFIVFVLGFMGTFQILRKWGFDYLKERALPEEASVNAITAFDVVLLQTKVSLICGILVAIPVLFYVSRDALRARGLFPKSLFLAGSSLFSDSPSSCSFSQEWPTRTIYSSRYYSSFSARIQPNPASKHITRLSVGFAF
ncbi:twin-arginine translocase subunit TatC [Halocatena marina]|uniref:Twin-arginine translocase subunit TatC n=1 Tax=Halocatena marina TaxID=2934937 RepID=A0ABD5YS01_9EURY